jgi:hypothetical protein
MTSLRRWLPVAALAAWALVGLGRAAHQTVTAPRAPAWERHLAPLADAPLPAGSAVALAAATRGGADDFKAVLMEAAWQRPDLHWAALSAWPVATPPRLLVTVGAAAAPTGWHEVWRRSEVAVHTRSAP